MLLSGRSWDIRRMDNSCLSALCLSDTTAHRCVVALASIVPKTIYLEFSHICVCFLNLNCMSHSVQVPGDTLESVSTPSPPDLQVSVFNNVPFGCFVSVFGRLTFLLFTFSIWIASQIWYLLTSILPLMFWMYSVDWALYSYSYTWELMVLRSS